MKTIVSNFWTHCTYDVCTGRGGIPKADVVWEVGVTKWEGSKSQNTVWTSTVEDPFLPFEQQQLWFGATRLLLAFSHASTIVVAEQWSLFMSNDSLQVALIVRAKWSQTLSVSHCQGERRNYDWQHWQKKGVLLLCSAESRASLQSRLILTWLS